MKIKSLIFGLFLASVSVSAFSQNSAQKPDCATKDNLTATTLKGKYSYVDCFYDDLAIVADNVASRQAKFGFIDTTGKLVIPLKFDNAVKFEQGLALVRQDDKQFFIDKTGKKAFNLDNYLAVFPFSEGLAFVIQHINNKQKFGYIDTTGKLVIPAQFDRAEDFKSGLAVVKQGDKQFFIDKTGKKAIDLTGYVQADSFNDGLAKVRKTWDCNNKYGYLNTKGKLVIPMQFEDANNFQDGLALVTQGNKRFFIDTTGKKAIDLAQYDNAESFSNGLAKVATYSELNRPKYGFIDTTGKVAIPLEYSDITVFKEGKAYASKTDQNGNKRMGIINLQNQTLIPFDYSLIAESNYGLLTAVKGCDKILGGRFDDKDVQKCRYGVIDEQNNVVIPFDYNFISSFKNGVAIVQKDKMLGKIDKTGKIVVPFTAESQNALQKEMLRQ